MAKTLPLRKDVKVEDTWDLSSLFKNDAAWETAFKKWSKDIEGVEKYKGTLGKGPKQVLSFLECSIGLERTADRLGNYAFLKGSEDEGNTTYQRMKGRMNHVAVRFNELSSFFTPELLSLSDSKIEQYLNASVLKDWKLFLGKILRNKPHTLSQKEENILAKQGQISGSPSIIFNQLTDVDLKWGTIQDEDNSTVDVNHSSFSRFLRSPSRRVRKDSFEVYYKAYADHQNTLAAAYNASVQTDVYYAKVRNHKSALSRSLFADNVPKKVYDNLIAMVHELLPDVYRYIKIRNKKLKIKESHQYDVYVPIASDIQKKTSWSEAVDLVEKAVHPLGTDYVQTLKAGLTSERWSDKYPNVGKHSGAFSSGVYKSKPYILMNYDEQVFDHVFTLAHEAGHSMHSHLAGENQLFQYADYTIFTAEIASTFNEQLLLHSLLAKADKKEKVSLLNHAVDAFRTTVIRQVMFAEYEKRTHELAEKGEPLTIDLLRAEYRKLLELYFGPDFVIDPELEFEGLRIPHFYRAFYVYKYATGLISAIALSDKVLKGGEKERERYLDMLRAGGSDWPLALLKKAGVDLEKKESLQSVVKYFKNLIDELEGLL